MLGYHPILATRADTGEVLHARMRKGPANTQRGARRFIDELVARVRRAGATGELTVRVDSGFWSNDTIATLNRLDVRYTMAVRCQHQRHRRGDRGDRRRRLGRHRLHRRRPSPSRRDAYTTGNGRRQVTRRLVVRRTRLTDPAQQRLWPDWRHHAFLTDLDGDAVDVDAFHRHHAVVELAIRDLKEGAGLDHVPSGNFHANSAWLQCAVLAHNLIRWTATLGDVRVDDELTVARTIRTRLIALPGRLVNRAGRPTLRLPDRWPWADTFTTALDRAPPAATRSHLNAGLAVRRAALTPPALTTPEPTNQLTRREPSQPVGTDLNPTTQSQPAHRPDRWIEA